MKKINIFFVVIISVLLYSCRVKDTCELNHSGTISITNAYNSTVELYVDNQKVADLFAGETKNINKTVGTYEVKAIAYPEDWTETISVSQCEVSLFEIK